MKQLLRRAAVAAAEARRSTMADDDVRAVLDDLLTETSTLTRVLLGGQRRDAHAVPGPHDWLETTSQRPAT